MLDGALQEAEGRAGVPVVSRRARKELPRSGLRCPGLQNEQASQWRDNKVQAIEAWLAGGEEDASTLEIEPMNAFMRRVMYSEITSIQDRQAALGADTVSLWWEKVEQPRGNWVGLVLQKMTGERARGGGKRAVERLPGDGHGMRMTMLGWYVPGWCVLRWRVLGWSALGVLHWRC